MVARNQPIKKSDNLVPCPACGGVFFLVRLNAERTAVEFFDCSHCPESLSVEQFEAHSQNHKRRLDGLMKTG